MCIVVSTVLSKAMFGCTRGCRQQGRTSNTRQISENSNITANSAEFELDDGFQLEELPSLTPLKLTRHREVKHEERVANPPTLAEAACPARLTASSSNKTGVRRRASPGRQFLACARGDVQELSEWFNTCEGDANARDSEGWPLILHASMHGKLECVQLLIKLGARYDVCSGAGHSPLHVASANHHCSVVKSLVEAGASIDVQNCHGNTPLHSAAATGAVDVVKYLLSRAANPDVLNSVGETADRVSGAGPEVFLLLKEARRQKQARIAQRLALLSLHVLWSAGRAEPRTPIFFSEFSFSSPAPSPPPSEAASCPSSPEASTVSSSSTRSSVGGENRQRSPARGAAEAQERNGAGEIGSACLDGNRECGARVSANRDTPHRQAAGTVRKGDEGVEGCVAGADDDLARECAPIAGVACELAEWPGVGGTSVRQDGGDFLPDGGSGKDVLSPKRRLFESTVAGVAALPDEVVRRLVGFCTL